MASSGSGDFRRRLFGMADPPYSRLYRVHCPVIDKLAGPLMHRENVSSRSSPSNRRGLSILRTPTSTCSRSAPDLLAAVDSGGQKVSSSGMGFVSSSRQVPTMAAAGLTDCACHFAFRHSAATSVGLDRDCLSHHLAKDAVSRSSHSFEEIASSSPHPRARPG